jgi:single-strand DNA-binding protein
MYHKVIIIGYLGRDPEMRYTPSGVPVVDFSVATSRKWKNKDGTPADETVWFRCTGWRELAETVNQYLHKGSKVFIEGRLNPDPASGNPRIYTRKDGTSGASYELTVENVKFLDARGAGEGPGTMLEEEPPPPSRHEADIPF